ncbi:unnamed protein product [Schistosoma mattheei]|uniref:Uncharacterized protein n=1 Tax=Schistosoma mattheei TaxID=31246 RepID=A0A183NY99_9TREM|nr:unnamed protein product [Schistosoma mattheei]
MEKELLWRATGRGSKRQSTSTFHEVLDHKKHHHKEWITVDILNKIQERRNKKAAINTSRTRAEKAKAQAEYAEVNKQVKRSIRTDKRKYVEDLATTAEKATREGNMRQLYDTTKKLSGNRRKPEQPVKSKGGRGNHQHLRQQNKWVEHFEELLNRTAPPNPPNIEAAPTDLPINIGPPTIEEISMAIRQIKSDKAAGPDNVPPEALKADVAATAKILHILFNKIWDEEQVPKDWKEGLLIKIPKKGDLSNCDNYRGITLLSISGKSLQQGIVKQDEGLRRRPTS